MKTRFLLITLATISLTFVSCKKELEPQESSSAVRASEATTTSGISSPAQVSSPQSSTQQITTNASNSSQGLNPAHGQPGHRCDIAVGAPLNKTTTGNQMQQMTTSSTAIQPATNNQPVAIQNANIDFQQPTKTAKGMNPPHGQPGHRCDIPVGMPLNSKGKESSTTTQTNTTSVTQTNTATTTPSLLTPTPTATAAPIEVAAGTNPPHGQPGHVCGTPVGSQLNTDKKEEKKE